MRVWYNCDWIAGTHIVHPCVGCCLRCLPKLGLSSPQLHITFASCITICVLFFSIFHFPVRCVLQIERHPALLLSHAHIHCVHPENEKSIELCAELEEDVALLQVVEKLLSRPTLRVGRLVTWITSGQVDYMASWVYSELGGDEAVSGCQR
ncbi:hypothetical protein EDB92DRAFT_1829138 [Lactarius akahatsu]|uniref:Uncharacterized protein n=1 Tax=Lactarius akahatsu TaxID=416441 RepID=A0AAD4QHI1_9AGAM|nr:hypothetical protein EDB92DRAFT_1829138 [Lactarius akahatsu]